MKILVTKKEREVALGLFMGCGYGTVISAGLTGVNIMPVIGGFNPTAYLLGCTLGILGAVLMFSLTYEIPIRNFNISPLLAMVGFIFNLAGAAILSSSVVIMPLNTMFMWLLFVMYSDCVLRIAKKMGFKFEISRRELKPWANPKEKRDVIIGEIIVFLLLLLVTYLVIYHCYSIIFHSYLPFALISYLPF